MQLKAETHVLADLEVALQSVAHIGLSPTSPLKSLAAKQDLLRMLINNEQTRLLVWLFPLDHNGRHRIATHHASSAPSDVCVWWSCIGVKEADTMAEHIAGFATSRLG